MNDIQNGITKNVKQDPNSVINLGRFLKGSLKNSQSIKKLNKNSSKKLNNRSISYIHSKVIEKERSKFAMYSNVQSDSKNISHFPGNVRIDDEKNNQISPYISPHPVIHLIPYQSLFSKKRDACFKDFVDFEKKIIPTFFSSLSPISNNKKIKENILLNQSLEISGNKTKMEEKKLYQSTQIKNKKYNSNKFSQKISILNKEMLHKLNKVPLKSEEKLNNTSRFKYVYSSVERLQQKDNIKIKDSLLIQTSGIECSPKKENILFQNNKSKTSDHINFPPHQNDELNDDDIELDSCSAQFPNHFQTIFNSNNSMSIIKLHASNSSQNSLMIINNSEKSKKNATCSQIIENDLLNSNNNIVENKDLIYTNLSKYILNKKINHSIKNRNVPQRKSKTLFRTQSKKKEKFIFVEQARKINELNEIFAKKNEQNLIIKQDVLNIKAKINLTKSNLNQLIEEEQSLLKFLNTLYMNNLN